MTMGNVVPSTMTTPSNTPIRIHSAVLPQTPTYCLGDKPVPRVLTLERRTSNAYIAIMCSSATFVKAQKLFMRKATLLARRYQVSERKRSWNRAVVYPICRSVCVGLSVRKCIVAKRLIGSGCYLG